MPSYDEKDILDRKTILEKIRIQHPYYRLGMEKIESCWARSKYSTEPKSLFITGEAGTGKTELFKAFCNVNDEVQLVEENGEIIRKKKIIHIRLPYPANISGIIYRMLEDLGDDFPGAGKNDNQKTERLIYFIKKCGVEIICFDEFQNFVDRDKVKTLKAGSEWVKNLINDTNIPFVFFGTLQSRNIISANEGQLKRRVENNHIMKRYDYKNMKDRKLFSGMLNIINDMLPFDESSMLYESNMAARIYAATDGLMHSIMSLITTAGHFAIDDGSSAISLDHLDKAFRTNSFLHATKNENPFKHDFIKNVEEVQNTQESG